MIEAVSDRLGNGRFGGDFGELRFEPVAQGHDLRLALLLTHRAAFVGGSAADCLFDLVELGDADERFRGDRRVAFLGDIVESPAQMRPTEGEHDPVLIELLVGSVAVALHDAVIIGKQSGRVYRAAPRRIGVDDARRIGAAPGPVVAGHRPEVARLGPPASGIEHRYRCLIDGELGRGQQDRAHPLMKRHQFSRGIAHPERQR